MTTLRSLVLAVLLLAVPTVAAAVPYTWEATIAWFIHWHEEGLGSLTTSGSVQRAGVGEVSADALSAGGWVFNFAEEQWPASEPSGPATFDGFVPPVPEDFLPLFAGTGDISTVRAFSAGESEDPTVGEPIRFLLELGFGAEGWLGKIPLVYADAFGYTVGGHAVPAVPEPVTWAFLTLGAVGLAAWRGGRHV